MHDLKRPTIYAPATGTLPSAIAVIRISGPAAHEVLGGLIEPDLSEPRRLYRRWLRDTEGVRIDDVLIARFDAGASYTGEPMAEVHCHGSRAVVNRILDVLQAFPDCRLAEPGEFTLRALHAGRIDLSEAEGLSALIAAETEEQRRQAVRIFSGALQERVEVWRESLLRALTLIEVTIDWADEEVPEDVEPEVLSILDQVMTDLETEFASAGGARRLREGFEVALIGPTNAGKSSLLNRIAKRDAAIVSEIEGTTRDVIEVRYDLDGLLVTFLDTAGIRETDDPVEQIGIHRSEKRAAAADLRVLLRPIDMEVDVWQSSLSADLEVASKSDLGVTSDARLQLSSVSGQGVDDLLGAISALLRETINPSAVLTHRRHEDASRRAIGLMEEAKIALTAGSREIAAHLLRNATEELEMIVGRIGTEDVLTGVFGSFCLGK